ncbi:MAG: ABC transporter permease [Geminicoccaceae bacterium]
MQSAFSQPSPAVAVIEPDGTSSDNGLAALWRRRELVMMLAVRSIRVRYRDTSLGIVWAFAHPLLYMIVISTFFGLVARFETGAIPYPLHLLIGLIAFQLFAKSVGQGSNAISGNRDILQKIYIPPIVFPAANVLSSLIDFLFPAILIMLFLMYYGVTPTWTFGYLPLTLVWLITLCMAAQIAMSVLAVRFNDIPIVVPIITQLLFFATPIFYPISIIPVGYRAAYGFLNPMAGVIDLLRWCLLGTKQPLHLDLVMASAASTLIVVTASIVIFRLIARGLHRYL